MKGCGHNGLVETDTGTQGHGEIFWTSPTRFDRTPNEGEETEV